MFNPKKTPRVSSSTFTQTKCNFFNPQFFNGFFLPKKIASPWGAWLCLFANIWGFYPPRDPPLDPPLPRATARPANYPVRLGTNVYTSDLYIYTYILLYTSSIHMSQAFISKAMHLCMYIYNWFGSQKYRSPTSYLQATFAREPPPSHPNSSGRKEAPRVSSNNESLTKHCLQRN